MDQQLNKSQDEILSKLLANPANDAPSYFNDLQRLVDDYPQSGILRALLTYCSEEKNIKQAAAYYSPISLFKLMNDISSLPGVPEDRIVIEKSLRAKKQKSINGYASESAGVADENDQDHHTGSIENYFSDPAETDNIQDDVESNGNKLAIDQEGDLSLIAAEKPGPELTDPPGEDLNGHIAFAPKQSEIINISSGEAVEESVNGEDMLPSAYVEDMPEELPVKTTAIESSASAEHFELIAQDTLPESSGVEPVGSVSAAVDTLPGGPDHDQKPQTVDTIADDTDTRSDEGLEEQTDYINDEVFDEILGIEYIDISRQPARQTRGAANDQEPETGRETELTAEGIAPGDFFSIEDAPGENGQPQLTEDKLSTDNKTDVQVTEAAATINNEQQDVAKYNDDKMPYTFMWWLDKTRRQHSGIFQPYVKPDTEEVLAAPKQEPDELQQQYYENIFHITSAEEIGKNIPTPPFAAVPKRKEQVIIERFIKEEPQIRPQSSDKLDNENKAKKSAEDKDELVTETLAVIYNDQMLYHKAIASYKKLMLKFPEKSGYFADKIAQVEKKIN